MKMLLDTCVLSEFIAKHPDAGVVGWLREQDEDRLFISTITLGELQYGVARLPASQRRERLAQWLATDIVERFDGRVLVVNAAVMLRWGDIRAQLEKAGRPLPAIDMIIAATALTHDLQLVTRNVRDYAGTNVRIINPWSEQLT